MSSGSGKIEAEATVAWSGWGGAVTGASGKLNAETATQVELGGPGDQSRGAARRRCPICNVPGATAEVTLSVSVTCG